MPIVDSVLNQSNMKSADFSYLDTKLTPEEEPAYQEWKSKYAPNDSGFDYDLKGAFKAGVVPDENTGHMPDTFKKPNHPTFSDQSKFYMDAPNWAGSWDGDKYIPSPAKVMSSGYLKPQDLYYQPPRVKSEKIHDATWGEAIEADYNLFNPFYRYFDQYVTNNLSHENTDPNFNPLDHVPRGFEDGLPFYANANNQRDIANVTGYIQMQRARQELLQRTGTAQDIVGMFAAGVADPTMLVPTTGGLKFIRGAETVAGKAGRSALLTSASMLPYDELDAATDPTHTLKDSAVTIGTGTLIGGLLGPALAHTPISEVKKAEENLAAHFGFKDTAESASELNTATSKEDLLNNYADSVGAARAPNVVDPKGLSDTMGLDKVTSITSPKGQITAGPVQAAKDILYKLITPGAVLKENKAGIATAESIEGEVSRLAGTENALIHDIGNEIYPSYLKRIKGTSEAKLTKEEFFREVGKANHLGDEHVIPEVQLAAQRYRSEVHDPHWQLMKDVGLIKEDAAPEFKGGLKSYATIAFDKIAVKQKLQEMTADLLEHFKAKWLAEHGELPTGHDLHKMEVQANETPANITRGKGIPVIDGYAQDPFHPQVGQNVVDQITGGTRKLDLPVDKLFKYIELDPRATSWERQRQLNKILMYDRFKTLDIGEILSPVQQEIANKLKELQGIKKTAYQYQANQALQNLTHIMKAMTGELTPVSDLAKNLQKMSYLSSGGGFLVSSFNDVATPIITVGMKPILTTALATLGSGMKTLKLGKKEALLANAIISEVSRELKLNINNVYEDLRTNGRIGKVLQYGTEKLARLSMIEQYTNTVKSFSALAISHDVLEQAAKVAEGKKIPEFKKALLLSYGIDDAELAKIYEQYQKYGTKSGALMIPNTNSWDNKAAIRKFRYLLSGEINTANLTGSYTKADMPKSTNTSMGSVIAQFHRYSFLTTNKLAIRAAQKRDFGVAAGLMTAVAIGAGIAQMKAAINGEPMIDDTDQLIREGIDRSGVLGVGFDLNDMMETATSGEMGLAGWFGLAPNRRYGNVSTVGVLSGPSGQVIESMVKVARGINNGKMTKGQALALQKLTPFYSLFYLRYLFGNSLAEAASGQQITSMKPQP